MAVGCSSGGATAVTDAQGKTIKPVSGNVYTQAPSSAPTGSTIQVKPANPDDPHFKQDPKLAGGG